VQSAVALRAARGNPAPWREWSRNESGRLWRAWRRFREDVGDDSVDFFGASDLDDAGEESLPRLGTWAAVDD
jgi:hypothetical protein